MESPQSFIPSIRFEGFSDPWEQRKVGELSKRVIVGLATSVTPYYRQEGIPILRNLNIKENYLDDTDILFLERAYAENQVSKQIHTGDVLTVHTGYIGTSCIVPAKYDNCLTFTTLITTTDDVILHSEFLAQYLNSEFGMAAVQAVTTQGGRQNLNTNDFVKVEIRYPSLAEQEAICGMLRNLDTLITLHQRKYDRLKNVKKSMLEKMFPRDGSNVPEIRFAGFIHPWEQHKLGDVAKYRNGKAHESVINDDGKYVVVNSKFISTDGEVKKYSNAQIEPLIKDEIALVLSDVPNGRAIARTFLVDESGKYTLNQRIAGITPLDITYPYFLYILMNRNKYFLSFDDGAKQTNLSISDVMNFGEKYPSYDEQRKIGECFEGIDNLIVLHRQKYYMLKQIKNSLLQKMFK